MRVAVCQFATSLNVQENLATCTRMINEVATCEPALIVLPEFCNTQFCSNLNTYSDHNQAWQQALSIDDMFLQEIAAQALKFGSYIVLNVTLRRDPTRDHQNGAIQSNISITSCLFSPQGELVQQSDKQALTGYEVDFFVASCKAAETITTPLGKVGLLSGSDSIGFESSRTMAFAGAQLLCNSLSSFALDHSRLHGPARACENNVFLVSANKVGSLASQECLQQATISPSLENVLSPEYFVGVGQSQIVAPSGKVLAKLANNEQGFVFADIDLTESDSGELVGLDHKVRPDGSSFGKQLRPELYQAKEQSVQLAQNLNDNHKTPDTTNVAIFATYKTNEQAIEDVCHYIENNLSDIIQLPELFFVADKSITDNTEQLSIIEKLSNQFIEQVTAVLRPFQYVCTSLVIDGQHQAVLISEQGIFAKQAQLHFCQRYQWTALGNELNIIKLPLEQGDINLAMLTADDANIAELVKVATEHNIHALLVPFDIQEPCEVEYSLLSRAAENNICIVAASREKSFANYALDDTDNLSNTSKIKSKKSTGLIANITPDFSLLPQWQAPKFNGYIHLPIVKHQYGKITKALIHPISACTRDKV